MTIGERIKNLRKGKGWTQQRLADEIEKSHGSIASYEADRRKPSLGVLEDLADLFDVSIDYLAGRSEYKKVAEAIEGDEELLAFWQEMKDRNNLKMMFKQTRDLPDDAIKDVLRIIKRIEIEEDSYHPEN